MALLAITGAALAQAQCPPKAADIKTATQMRACFDVLNQAQAQLAATQAALDRRLANLDAKTAATAARVAALPAGLQIVLRDHGASPGGCFPGEQLVGGNCWLSNGSGILQNAGIAKDPGAPAGANAHVYNCTWTVPPNPRDVHMEAACLTKAP